MNVPHFKLRTDYLTDSRYRLSDPVAYLGGPRCDAPPLARPWKFFTGDFIWKGAFFAIFSKNCKIQQCLMVFCVSKFQKNGRICGFHWTFRSKKCFSFRGASPPWLPDQGLCSWTPRYRLALRAVAMAPLCQILNAPLIWPVKTKKRSRPLANDMKYSIRATEQA